MYEYEKIIMEDKMKNQQVFFQGKNQKASEGWFDLITQIALDYRRLNDPKGSGVEACIEISKNVEMKKNGMLNESNDALAL